MKILSAHQVMQKRMEGKPIHLIMTLSPRHFAQAHIPGSLNIWDMQQAKEKLPLDAPIIVYCSDERCMASYAAYEQLKQAGYQHIWRFAGGLLAWSEAGYPLTGTLTPQ